MPIEIKELIIRAAIHEEADQAREPSSPATDPSQEERIVSRCVEQVMHILRIQNER